MDITQLLLTAGAIVGILVVALVAVVPTLMEIPTPDEPVEAKPRPRTGTSTRPAGGPRPHLHLPV